MAGGGGSSSNSTQDSIIQFTNPAAALEAGSLGASAAYTASQQVTQAINTAINSVNQHYQQAVQLLQPETTTGVQALDQLNQYLGLDPYNPGNAPVMPEKPTLASEMQNVTQADINSYIGGNVGPQANTSQTINGNPLTGNASVSTPVNGYVYNGVGVEGPGAGPVPYTGGGFLSNSGAETNNISGEDFKTLFGLGYFTGGTPTNSTTVPGLNTPNSNGDQNPVTYAQMQNWTDAQWKQWGSQNNNLAFDQTNSTTIGDEVRATLAEQNLPGDTKTYNNVTLPAYQNQQLQWQQENNWYNQYKAEGPLSAAQVNNKITNLPGYQAQLNQGVQAINNDASAQGYVGSGRMLKELMSFGQNTLSTFYGNELSRLAGIAGARQQAAQTTAGQSIATGNSLASLFTSLGTNQANSTLAGANSLSQALVAANQEFQSVQTGKSSSSSSPSFDLSGIGSLIGSLL